MFIYGATDDLYNVRFSKKFFSMRCIRLSTVFLLAADYKKLMGGVLFSESSLYVDHTDMKCTCVCII